MFDAPQPTCFCHCSVPDAAILAIQALYGLIPVDPAATYPPLLVG
jgi:hypothetical protein